VKSRGVLLSERRGRSEECSWLERCVAAVAVAVRFQCGSCEEETPSTQDASSRHSAQSTRSRCGPTVVRVSTTLRPTGLFVPQSICLDWSRSDRLLFSHEPRANGLFVSDHREGAVSRTTYGRAGKIGSPCRTACPAHTSHYETAPRPHRSHTPPQPTRSFRCVSPVGRDASRLTGRYRSPSDRRSDEPCFAHVRSLGKTPFARSEDSLRSSSRRRTRFARPSSRSFAPLTKTPLARPSRVESRAGERGVIVLVQRPDGWDRANPNGSRRSMNKRIGWGGVWLRRRCGLPVTRASRTLHPTKWTPRGTVQKSRGCGAVDVARASYSSVCKSLRRTLHIQARWIPSTRMTGGSV
jgi:hypothetical protein